MNEEDEGREGRRQAWWEGGNVKRGRDREREVERGEERKEGRKEGGRGRRNEVTRVREERESKVKQRSEGGERYVHVIFILLVCTVYSSLVPRPCAWPGNEASLRVLWQFSSPQFAGAVF